MTSNHMLTVALCVLASTFTPALVRTAAAGQAGPSLQASQDPREPALLAQCKNPPPAAQGRGRAGGGRGAAAGRGRGAQPEGPRDYTVTAIPGVIAAGQTWTFVWQELGNNGDGIIGTDDGGLLVAQNDNSRVVKLSTNGQASVVYSDTNTGGALSMSPTGALFIAARGFNPTIMQLAPQRRTLASSYQGDPLDCLGSVLNDLTADSRGGVYFTMGGVYYASPAGVVTPYGDNLRPNGIVLSADEQTLYVTNGPTLAAFDVRPDGSLTNQREFATLEAGGGGDGLTIDAAGRVYVATGAGVQVVGPDGRYLGVIPTPRGTISTAFGGRDKKTLFVLARGARDAAGTEVANAAQVYTIQMIAQGYMGRAK